MYKDSIDPDPRTMSSTRQYPPKPMTGNTTTIKDSKYGNGTYVASSSSEGGNGTVTKHAYHAFDRVVDNGKTSWEANHWHGENGTPQWLRLDMPVSVRLKKYVLYSRDELSVTQTDFPNQFKVEGSNDGSSWTTLDTQTNAASSIASPFEKKTFTVSTNKSFSKFRLNVENVGENGEGRGGGTNYVVVPEWEIHGEEEKNGAIWNPLEEGFWSAGNLGMWVYIGVSAVLVLILVMVLVM